MPLPFVIFTAVLASIVCGVIGAVVCFHICCYGWEIAIKQKLSEFEEKYKWIQRRTEDLTRERMDKIGPGLAARIDALEKHLKIEFVEDPTPQGNYRKQVAR